MTMAVCLPPSLSAAYLYPFSHRHDTTVPSLAVYLRPLRLVGETLEDEAPHPTEPYRTLRGILARYLISQISAQAFHLIHNSPGGGGAIYSRLSDTRQRDDMMWTLLYGSRPFPSYKNSFLSHCAVSWLHHSGSKQLDRYR